MADAVTMPVAMFSCCQVGPITVAMGSLMASVHCYRVPQ
jgi:hypothetical protein